MDHVLRNSVEKRESTHRQGQARTPRLYHVDVADGNSIHITELGDPAAHCYATAEPGKPVVIE